MMNLVKVTKVTKYFKKAIALSLLILVGSFPVFADEGRYTLVVYNVAAMTLTKLTVSNTQEQCHETMENFKAEFPNESRFLFSCIRLANGTE